MEDEVHSACPHRYLVWCKQRALEIFATGNTSAAVTSMLCDLQTWERGPLLKPDELAIRQAEARFYTSSADDVRDWIESFA